MDEPAGAGVERASVTGEDARAAVEAARERQSHVRHELRSPLAVMYPLLTLLLESGSSDLTAEQRRHLETLERCVIRLEGLIASAADSGWADCSGAPPAPAALALADVAEEVLTMRRIAGVLGPRLDVRSDSDAAPAAWADRDDVRQIAANLIGNATGFTPSAGTITVRIAAGHEAGTVQLAVVDSGPGVPADELPYVFDFGYRGALARQLRVPGLGAGLWVCRELARRNGGEVALESQRGLGTAVTLTLPAVSEETL